MADFDEYDFSTIPGDLLAEAKVLVGDGDNSEYLRGVCELLSFYVPTLYDHSEKAIALAIHLGVSPDNANRMY